MSQSSKILNNKMDLRELFATLWSHKILITLFTGLFIFQAGYYALTTEKIFTANALFKIEQNNSTSGLDISGDLRALTSIAGFASGAKFMNTSDSLIERATNREFIIKMQEKFSLENDIYFNSYNPSNKDPQWKAIVRKIIGLEKTKSEKNAIIENNVIKSYRESVGFLETDGGAILISVTHVNPKKAAFYANSFMEEIRLLVEEENIEAQRLRLNYLSETLADAIQEMETTQEVLKNYAFENSAMAQENFISDSLKLDKIRMEKRKVTEIADLLSLIEDIVISGNQGINSYETLRSNHPLVDDIDFRRILGMSETISAWAWPKIETIAAVAATLRDRINRLDVDIKSIEENAKIYASSAEDLAKYTRNAKIAEATYTVLIEQVKSQSLAAGFQPETFKVFAYATPPLSPSSPKRNLVLALGAVLGIFTGCVLSLLNGIRRGVYYTRSTLIYDVNPNLTLKSKTIRRLSTKSSAEIISVTSKKRIAALDQVSLQLADKKIIYVLNTGGRPTASNAARLLATNSAKSGRQVVLCDTTGQSEKMITEEPGSNNSILPNIRVGDNISVMMDANGATFLTSKSFKSQISELAERFDQVFICTSDKSTELGLMALAELSPSLILFASLRKTRKYDIKNIRSRQPVDILFHD